MSEAVTSSSAEEESLPLLLGGNSADPVAGPSGLVIPSSDDDVVNPLDLDDDDDLLFDPPNQRDDSTVKIFGYSVPLFFWRRWKSSDEEVGHQKISNCDTIFHLLKGNIGTGILAMPDAIKNSGLLLGSVGLIFMSVICVHCMHMLVKAAHRLKALGRRGAAASASNLTYPDVMELAFKESPWAFVQRKSKWGRKTINVFLCLTQFGFCCVYFVFVAQNIKIVIDHHMGKLSYHIYIIMMLPFVLILTSVRQLKHLAPISILATGLQVVGLALTFFYLVQDLPSVSDRKMFAEWHQLPLYFGTAIYAFEGIGVVLPLENQMREPGELGRWNGVLNTAMVIVSCLYIAVGFYGYLKYGETVQGSITLNLPVEQWLAQIVIIVMSLAIFFSYALQFYVPLEILLPPIQAKFSQYSPMKVDYAVRYLAVFVTFALAEAIPRLDLFISLVGALSSSTLALLAPPLIDTLLFWEQRRRNSSVAVRCLHMAKNIFLFVVGFLGFATGSYFAVKNIIHFFVYGE